MHTVPQVYSYQVILHVTRDVSAIEIAIKHHNYSFVYTLITSFNFDDIFAMINIAITTTWSTERFCNIPPKCEKSVKQTSK